MAWAARGMGAVLLAPVLLTQCLPVLPFFAAWCVLIHLDINHVCKSFIVMVYQLMLCAVLVCHHGINTLKWRLF